MGNCELFLPSKLSFFIIEKIRPLQGQEKGSITVPAIVWTLNSSFPYKTDSFISDVMIVVPRTNQFVQETTDPEVTQSRNQGLLVPRH